jgi:predicted methyltransferase
MMTWSARFSRRNVCRRILGLGALASVGLLLDGCGRKAPSQREAAASDAVYIPPVSGAPGSLEWAVAGEWRSRDDRARDVWRHPVQTLRFWGLKPGMTVLEFWPGVGWYTDILAPYLARNGGTLIAAQLPPNGDPAQARILEAYRKKLAARPGLYGQPHLTAFGPTTGALAPDSSVDLAIIARNLHDWMMGGFVDKAFHDAFKALKPGGVLSIEDHRGTPGAVQDVLASDGYVQESYVKQLAMEAGFLFDSSSEINANPKDNHSHPFGVWTLPPTRQSAPTGRPEDARFDHKPYDAIGESDRMTLRFVKPK